GIVPLIPYETATQFCHGEGFKLAGTTQPIRPAPLSIRFDSQLSRGIKLVLQVNPEVRGRVSLFCRRNGGWDSLGLAGIWLIKPDNLAPIELGLVAVPFIRQGDNRAGCSWARAFRLEISLVSAEAKEIFSVSVCFKIPPILLASSI